MSGNYGGYRVIGKKKDKKVSRFISGTIRDKEFAGNLAKEWKAKVEPVYQINNRTHFHIVDNEKNERG